LDYTLLGPVEASSGGRTLRLGGGKAKALLARLLLEESRAVPVDRLIDELWPGDPPASAAHAVQVYVSTLRKAGIEIERRGSGYRLRREPDELDADRFEGQLAAGLGDNREGRPADAAATLREALALWRGEPLGGVPPDLLADERRRLDELRLAAIEARIDAELTLGLERSVISELEALVAREPLNERFRAQLILALYRSGRQGDALAAYREARLTLVDELVVEPAPALRALHRAVLVQDPALDAGAAGEPTGPGRLPSRPRPLVGREHEIVELRSLLARKRLVTLAGAGGCGKTALAVAVARPEARTARFVELAPLDDGALVPQAVLAALGLPPSADREPVELLVEHVRTRRLLLVLDNCEHLLPACATLVTHLLDACPEARALATSREPLALEGESVWRVPPLLTPEEEPRPVEQLPQYGAIRLFLERAGVDSPVELTRENSEAVSAICRATGGLPLAIELAAAQVPELGVAAVAARAGSPLELLATREPEGRHGSMERTIDWTVRLLSEAEQLLFARLSVFAGGWAREAAEAVGADVGRRTSVAAALERLVVKSLVSFDHRSGRHGMLEPIRHFAARLLEQEGATDAARLRHAEHFALFAEDVGAGSPVRVSTSRWRARRPSWTTCARRCRGPSSARRGCMPAPSRRCGSSSPISTRARRAATSTGRSRT